MAAAAPMPYLLRPVPALLVLGSFFLLTLPISAVVMNHPSGFSALPFVLYMVGLSITHFWLTFAVYLSGDNRRHFVSSARNRLIFWVAPLGPALFLGAWYGLALDARFWAATAGISAAVRGLDYVHLSRQSFGVLQLFKLKGGLPAWLRGVENGFFLSLALLLYASYLNQGRFNSASEWTWAAVTLSAALGIGLLWGYGAAWRSGCQKRQVALSTAYLTLQTAAALLAVWRLELYTCALAMHVVEYHVVMSRRVFHAPAAANDRLLNLFRRVPAFLGALLVAAAVGWFLLWRIQDHFTAGPWATRLLVHAFDGLFVFHYILEMSIWKFGDPYFGKTLAPLYVA